MYFIITPAPTQSTRLPCALFSHPTKSSHLGLEQPITVTVIIPPVLFIQGGHE